MGHACCIVFLGPVRMTIDGLPGKPQGRDRNPLSTLSLTGRNLTGNVFIKEL